MASLACFKAYDIRGQLGTEQHTKADTTYRLSLEFSGWRMNIWASNAEPLLRLNIELRDAAGLVQSRIDELEVLIARQ